MYLSATWARRWPCVKSRRLTRCAEVSRYKVRGEGGAGGSGLGGSLATRCAFGFTAAGGGVGGSSSIGVGMGSTFTFLRGARSLLPEGRPLFGAGASMASCALFEGIVSEFSGVVVEFSTIVVEFSGIFASASAIF